jgi:hypothetical protein
MIAELLEDGDLLEAEFNDIWEAAPKFPTCAERIDVDSFVQIYRDIDDLFEDQDEEEEGGAVENNTQVVHVPEDDDGDDADQELLEATIVWANCKYKWTRFETSALGMGGNFQTAFGWTFEQRRI